MQQRESAKKAATSAAAAAAATGRGDNGIADDSTAASFSQNPVLRTASWLDRAKSLTRKPSDDLQGLPRRDIEHQMQEVQRLLNEGPTMQQASSDIPHLVDRATASDRSSPPPGPADKRLRTGAEDAEALVGFLRSVRASAASGDEIM